MRFCPSLVVVVLLLWFAPARCDEVLKSSLETPRLQAAALAIARRALVAHFEKRPQPPLPADLPDIFKRRAGVIVTLEMPGRITPRGCRGTLQPSYASLGEEIARNAVAAATRDAHEKPLRKSELQECRISLTVILAVRPIQNLSEHNVARNGLIAQRGERIGLVLPYEGKDAATQWRWARAKAGLKEHEKAQMLEVEAVRFREP